MYKMPLPSRRINMNLNLAHSNNMNQAILTNLVKNQQIQQAKAPTALNSPMISRVHNVRPGCGSCGKH